MDVNTGRATFFLPALPPLAFCQLSASPEGLGEPRKTLFSGTLSIVQLALKRKKKKSLADASRHADINIISNLLCILCTWRVKIIYILVCVLPVLSLQTCTVHLGRC